QLDLRGGSGCGQGLLTGRIERRGGHWSVFQRARQKDEVASAGGVLEFSGQIVIHRNPRYQDIQERRVLSGGDVHRRNYDLIQPIPQRDESTSLLGELSGGR